jgi:hypothetical protein
MAGRKMDPEEERAGAILAAVFEGTAEDRDGIGAPDKSHDFDVFAPNGSRIALEVTSSRDPQILRFYANLSGQVWPTKTLADEWIVSIRPPKPSEELTIRDLKRLAESFVTTFFNRGYEYVQDLEFLRWKPEIRADADITAAIEEMSRLGVRSIPRLGPPKSGESPVIYLTVGQGVTSDPGGINESCERAATVKGPKLGAADADETL